METDLRLLQDLLTAFGVGVLIGIERGWKGRAREEGSRVAGVRTFSLVGLLGGIIGRLAELTGQWLLATAFLAISVIVSAAYITAARKSDDIGITSPIALLMTFSLGAWAIYGSHVLVFGVAVLVVALLGFKPEIHRWISSLDTDEIYAGIKLLIISVILLPLLPDQGYGPFGAINPYWLWLMVVLITGLSFIGYITTRHFGDRIGTLLTALSGGLASSTAVTLSLAQMTRRKGATSLVMIGVLIASSIMFVRILIEVFIVNSMLLYTLWVPILAMLSTTLLGMLLLWRSGKAKEHDDSPSLELDNPFQIRFAIKFALLLGVIILLAEAMKLWFGEQGIYVLALISGLLDVDAITLTLSKMSMTGGLESRAAVLGIILSAISNTLVKGIMFTFISGSRASIRLVAIMAASGAAGLISVFLL